MSSQPKGMDKPKIGITVGDVNGIGPEVIIKVLSDQRILNHFIPVVFGSAKVLSFYRKALDIKDLNYSQVNDYKFFNNKINVVNCWKDMVDIQPGESTNASGKAAFLALEMAVQYLKDQYIDAVVTAPINKHNIQSDNFNFPGHTEYFTSAFEADESLMLLTGKDVRVGVVSGHVPLKDVSNNISKSLIIKKVKIMEASMKTDFGIGKPKIAVLGLNPHAGEDGLLGEEEDKVIRPAVKELKNQGKLVYGPFPADGFFGKQDYKKFDAVLAMYHDQGLIPFKTLEFESGVNFTAGLPIVRTSPDHGTAYDIAGKNVANPSSMREALYLAYDILKNRKEYHSQ